MIVLVNLVLMFMYLYTLLNNNVLTKYGTGFVQRNLTLFIAVFVFQLFIRVISSFLHKCEFSIRVLINNSLKSAVLAVIGYLLYNNFLKERIPIEMRNRYFPTQSETVISTLVITLSISIFKVMGFLLQNDNLGCLGNGIKTGDVLDSIKSVQDDTLDKLKDVQEKTLEQLKKITKN